MLAHHENLHAFLWYFALTRTPTAIFGVCTVHGLRIFPCMVNPYSVLDYQSTYLGAVHFAYSPLSISHCSHWGISHISFKIQIFQNIICLGTVHKCDKTHTTLLGVISLQLMSSLDRFKSKISMNKMFNEWNAQKSLKCKINIKSF